MAELNRDQRFLPCLLDRLRDDEPKNQEESRTQRVISMPRYKEFVVRDLQWLFNASAQVPDEVPGGFQISDYPEARRSVINYGLRQLCGVTAPDMAVLERDLSDVLKFFEPRILRHTLTLRASQDRHLVSFELNAELWAEPVPERLHVQTLVDLENGQVALGDRGNG